MTAIGWLFALLLLALSPEYRCRIDRRNYDGERVTVWCGGLFQKTETWVCVEVAR